MIDHALAYARAGWRVLPIDSTTKEPACAGGVHSATCDETEIVGWWKRNPACNIAINCEQFWVLDIDPRNGGDATLLALIAQHGELPSTWTARTGGGGVHLYWKHDPRLGGVPLGTLGKDVPGIDVKGNGKHYVLAPPSVSGSGPYSWLVAPGSVELAAAPDWLIDLILRAKYRAPVDASAVAVVGVARGERVRLATAYACGIKAAVSGEDGQTAAIKAAAQVARGFALDEDEALIALAGWNARCSPPWTEGELRRKISDSLEGGTLPIGSLLAPPDYTLAEPEPFTEAELARAELCKEALVCEHSGSFYLYSPREGSYKGPYKATGVPAACRQHLKGVPGFRYEELKGKAWSLVSTPRLVERYGCTVSNVEYHARAPATAYDARSSTLHIATYHWNEWAPVFSRIVDELLRAQAGKRYLKYEAYLSQFRNLGQPLCALVLSGERDLYKSAIIDHLSRFWGNPDKPTPCDATQVLNRFADSLLRNPVVRSDEYLAKTETGKAIPERYRLSISSLVHNVERKGVATVALNTALRHMCAVNDPDRVFGGEVDNASTQATMERYLVLEIDQGEVAAWAERWAGTPELAELNRRGNPLILQHVRWIEENTHHVSEGRFFVRPDTDEATIRKARFADETLTMALNVALDASFTDAKATSPGQLSRMPLVRDEYGVLRLSPERVAKMWEGNELTRGCGLRRPSTQRLGLLLTKAGFKKQKNERASKNKWGGWAVDEQLLKQFIEEQDGAFSWEDFSKLGLGPRSVGESNAGRLPGTGLPAGGLFGAPGADAEPVLS